MLGGQQTQSDINLAKIRHSHASTSALTLDVDPTQIPILQSNTQATPTRSTRPTKTYGKKQQNERDSGPAQEESASATQTQDAPLGMQAKSKDGKSKVKKKESQKQKHKSSAPSEELPASPPATTDDRPKKKAKVGRTKKPDPSNAEKEHETVAAVEKKTPVSDSNAVGSSTTVLDQVIAPNTPPSPQVQKFSSPRRRSIVPDSDEDELATQQPSHINPSTRPLLQVSAQDTDDTTSSSQQGEGSKKRRRKSKAGGSGVSNGSVNQPTRKPAEPPVPIEKPIPLQGRGKKRTRESDTQEQRSGKAKRNKHKSAREPEPQPEEEQEALPASQVDELLDSQTQQASTFHPKTGVDGSVQTAPEPPSRAPPSPKTLRVHSSVEDVGVQTDQPAVSPPPEQTTAVAFAPEQQQSTIAAVPVFTRPHIGISSTDLAARLGTPEGAESWSKMIEYEEEMNRLCQVWVEERQRLFGLFVSTTPADDAQREPLSNATTLPQPSASEQEQEPRPSLAPGTSLPAPLAAVSTSALTTTSAPAPTPAVSATVSQAEARSVPKATKGGQETSSSSSEDESSSDSESESEKRRGDKKQMFPSSRNSLHLPPPPRKSTKGDIPSKSSPMRALAQPKPAPAPRLSLGNLRVSLSSDEEEADEDDDDESDDEEEDRAQDQTLTALGSPEPEVAPKPRRSTQRARSPSSDWPSSPQSAERRPLDTAEPQPLADQTSASMPGDQTRSQSPSASDAVSVNEVDKEKQPTEEGSVEELQSTRSERSESLPPTEHHQNEHFSPSRFSDAVCRVIVLV